MSNHDREGSRPSNRDAALERAWREASAEQPPSHLDAALIAAARKSVPDRGEQPNTPVPVRTPSRNWLTQWQPLAAAAAVTGLAFVLVQMLPREPNLAPSLQRKESAPVPAPTESQPQSQPRSSSVREATGVGRRPCGGLSIGVIASPFPTVHRRKGQCPRHSASAPPPAIKAEAAASAPAPKAKATASDSAPTSRNSRQRHRAESRGDRARYDVDDRHRGGPRRTRHRPTEGSRVGDDRPSRDYRHSSAIVSGSREKPRQRGAARRGGVGGKDRGVARIRRLRRSGARAAGVSRFRSRCRLVPSGLAPGLGPDRGVTARLLQRQSKMPVGC